MTLEVELFTHKSIQYQYNLFKTIDENYQFIRISTKTEHTVNFSSIQGMKPTELPTHVKGAW